MKKMMTGKPSKKQVENDYYGTYDAEKTPLNTYTPSVFEAIRKEFGLGPKNVRTTDETRLKKQRERFLQKQTSHICTGTKT